MKILIKNATLISMDDARDKIENGIDILIEDNKIVRIGKKINSDNIDKYIDATRMVVLPGFINTHAHAPMSIFRETLDGYNLQDWLNKKIWPMEDKLTNQDIYYASYLSFLEMIKTGTTTINDMYFMTEDIIQAMLETGIRLQTSRTLMSLGNGEERINQFKTLLENYINKDDKLTFNVGIHGLYTSDEQYVDRCVKLAQMNNLPIHMHFCENTSEVSDIQNTYLKTPTQILKDKFIGTKTILAHCVKLSVQDINDIKDMDVSVAHCPISNLKLGCGIANINEMIKNGINVALGTDGQGSGSNLDMFETMKYAALLQKGVQENPEILTAYEVLKMATINGAKALGMENAIGSITEGKLADIIIIDMEDIKLKPINNLISEIVYNVKGNNVTTTIINGQVVMENGKLLNVNESKIYKECEKIIQRISKN